MSENNRFIIDVGEPQHENAFFEYDESFDDYDFVFWVDDSDEILKKFNELSDKNEQIKQSYIQLKHRHSLLHDECLDAECERDSLKKDVNSLEEENEQLKQFKNNVVEVINNKMEDNVCNDYKMEVLKEIWEELKLDELSDENEELKKDIEEHNIDERLFDDLYFNQVEGI